jgi:hypothetical protein
MSENNIDIVPLGNVTGGILAEHRQARPRQ